MLLRILLDVHEMNLSLAITCNLLTDTNQITTVETERCTKFTTKFTKINVNNKK